jgi:hypothetical protein
MFELLLGRIRVYEGFHKGEESFEGAGTEHALSDCAIAGVLEELLLLGSAHDTHPGKHVDNELSAETILQLGIYSVECLA